MFKVIQGNRGQLEAEALRTIWLGDQEQATVLLDRLKPNRNDNLRLVVNGPHSGQKAPVQETE